MINTNSVTGVCLEEFVMTLKINNDFDYNCHFKCRLVVK